MLERAQKIVVTGGAGFIGSHLVDRLISTTQAQVVVLDNLSRGRLENLTDARSPRLTFIAGDLRDPALVDQVLREAEVVFHLGAQSTVMGALEDLEYSFSTNVIGTFNVLRSASQHRVARVVFASSREVYGEALELPVDEGQPLLAINHYGASKVMGEAYCRAFRHTHGLHTVVLRLANVYGPRDIGRVIPTWLRQATQGADLTVCGGKQIIDFIWVDWVVDALMRAADQDVVLPPINIGSGTGTPILQLAKRIAGLTGGQSRVHILPARPVEVTRYVANVDRMRSLLRIEPPSDPLGHLPSLVQDGSRLAAV
ncbi:MAG: SDR family NAD(P)-dependent oxidoreductase [Chloroflexota bacterium]|nr:SDR family NAD(P)-dependent oxidoreductase [Chloroflexota bacterium]